MRFMAFLGCAVGSLLLANASDAAIVTFNAPGAVTNVASGILSLDELVTSTSYTYANVAGAGFDLKVTSSSTMVNSTGDLNYVAPNNSLLFEFFAAGTTTKIDVLGFGIDWRDLDLDQNGIAGTFTIKDRLGNASILNTNSSVFTLGGSLVTVEVVGANGVTPDGIKSNASGNWDYLATAFISDLASTPLHSFSLDKTTDWIAPTSIRLRTDIAAVPEPASMAVWSLLGMVTFGGCYWRKRKQ